MKKNLIFLFTFLSALALAQAPQGINYQGVVRDNNGNALGNTNISLEIKIWTGDPNGGGSINYSEIHNNVLTDTFGLYSLVIGSKSGTGTGTFNAIPWSGGNLWVEVYVDPANGSSFNLVSSQKLMSVPYALYAANSGSGSGGSVNGAPHNIPKINPSGVGTKNSLIFERADSSGVGINSPTPHPDAVLDIVNTGAPGAAGKGLLIPRMTFAERNAITTSALHHGLLVYQTNAPNALNPQGFWYYDAITGSWLLLAPAQAVWTLSGNAPGTAGFIGTFDGNDMVFKTGLINPVERMRVLNAGNVQFGGSSTTSYVFPISKGAAGDILQLDPSGATNNLFWKPFGGSGNLNWSLSGNQGSVTDFLGTTDTFPLNIKTTSTVKAQPIIFSTGGGEQMRVHGNGFVGVGTNTPMARFHVAENSGSGPQVYVQNTAQGQQSRVRVATVDFSGNQIETEIGSIDGGSNISSVGRIATVTNHDLIFGAGTSNTEHMRLTTVGNVGIGLNNPLYKLDVSGTNNTTIINATNNGTGPGDAVSGYAVGNGAGVKGYNSSGGIGVYGYQAGIGGNAGVFEVSNINNTASAMSVIHHGKGPIGVFTNTSASNASAGIDVTTIGAGAALFATTTGTGSAGSFLVNNGGNTSAALNISTNATVTTSPALFATTTGGGSAGVFQLTYTASTSPSLFVTTSAPAPALKVNGAGATGAIAAVFNMGSVGVNTGTTSPTSGLDVKTSLGISLKKYPNAGTFSIPVTDQNVVHMVGQSGTTTFNPPDATLCPGRIMIFTADNGITGGTMNITPCCGQTLNGGTTQSFTLTTGLGKVSIGIISDGTNWHIIFKN